MVPKYMLNLVTWLPILLSDNQMSKPCRLGRNIPIEMSFVIFPEGWSSLGWRGPVLSPCHAQEGTNKRWHSK
jgi:hypothetical protein